MEYIWIGVVMVGVVLGPVIAAWLALYWPRHAEHPTAEEARVLTLTRTKR